MNVILNNTVTIILSLIALFALIFSYVIQNRKIASAVQCVSFLCVLSVVTYALLLGATLTEILVFILVFVVLNLVSFIPKSNTEKGEDKTVDKLKKDCAEESVTHSDKEDGDEL